MININQSNDGYFISRPLINQGKIKRDLVIAEYNTSFTSLPETRYQHMKAMQDFYRIDASLFTPLLDITPSESSVKNKLHHVEYMRIATEGFSERYSAGSSDLPEEKFSDHKPLMVNAKLTEAGKSF